MIGIEVKALEWRDYPGDRLTGESKERYGFHEFGYYIITRGSGVYFLGTFTSMGKMRPMGGFKLLDEAKAAAQQDFASRIRSCLLDKAERAEAAGIRDEPWVRDEDRRKQDAERGAKRDDAQ